MAGKESRAINFTKPISEEEAEKIFIKLSEVPMANVLIEAFRQATNPQSFRACSYEIYAGVKEAEVIVSMVLRQIQDRVDLDVYSGRVEDIPASGWVNVFCSNLATISAGPIRAGVWAAGKEDLMTDAILVHRYGTIALPTRSGKWFFNFMSSLASLANEFHFDVHEQPKFWQKEGRFGEKRGPEDLPDVE